VLGNKQAPSVWLHALNCCPRITENFVPCSDLAGEVVSIGSSVTEWKVGDRVTSNFCTDHIYGDHTNETGKSALGGGQDGVLTQYRVLPSHVSPDLWTRSG
jgi:NADPH:quinone reductase-like Zn-dependent oxidoreductase